MLFDAQVNACNFAHSTSCRHESNEHTSDELPRPYAPSDSDPFYPPDGDEYDETLHYSYGRDRMDFVHEPEERELYREASYDPHSASDRSVYYDYIDRHRNAHPDDKAGTSKETRQGPIQNPQTRQTYSDELKDVSSESYRPPPDYRDSFIGGDFSAEQDYTYDEPRRFEPERVAIPDPGPPVLDHRKDETFHYVHVDTIDPNIFKRIRGSMEVETRNSAMKEMPESDCTGRDGLFPHADDCGQYIQCANGVPHVKQCPSGTYFSVDTGICSFDDTYCKTSSSYGSDEISYSDSAERLEQIHTFMKTNLIEAKVNALTILRREAEAARHMISSSRPFTSVASFLGSTPYVHQLSMPAFLQLECLRMIKDKFQLSKHEMEDVMNGMGSALPINPYKVSPDMDYPIPTLSACPYPKNDENNNCDPYAPYRTFDGSCNNLRKPLWGKSFRALDRFLQPDYCDGIGDLRCASDGKPLPSARAVSAAMFAPDNTQMSPVHTVMHMTFGQFLAHDNERTAVTKLSKDDDGAGELVDVMCGEDGCSVEGPENRACEPIAIPRRDPDFTNKTCLMFVRTQEVMRDDCRLAPREQLNQLTAWFDASVVYGSTRNESDTLRDLSNRGRGRLKTTRHPFARRYRDLLPQIDNKDCRDLNSTIRCFNAGDGRVNEQVGLISMHTIFHREHNRMEEELHHINPHWPGQTLYQETRKIMAAIWQVIVYNEYLPLVLGPSHIRQFGLGLEKTGYWDGYDDQVNGDIKNSFATAAFRFGHSQIGDVVRLMDQLFRNSRDIDLSTVLRRPLTIYEPNQPGGSAVDSILLGMASQPAEIVDTHFTKEVTVRLFSENPPKEPGLDLPSLNIQRGRDHGIPTYNHWRAWCGLPIAKDFYDMIDVPHDNRVEFSRLYNTVDDVDLFAAGVVEEHVAGGMVGPTFACIIAHQFRNLRVGDRFWHETPDRNIGFSHEQLQEIRNITFAKMICNNADYIDTIQKFVMLQPIEEAFKHLGSNNYREAYSLAALYRGEDNERRPCSHLPQLDLTHWRD